MINEKDRVFNVSALADYLADRYQEKYKEDITILKMNKVLYLCFAYWGAFVRMGKNNIDNIETDYVKYFSEYLFDAEFKAGVYGPYIDKLPKMLNKYMILSKKEMNLYHFIVKNQYNGEVFKFIDPLIRDAFEANEFDLMDISMKDEEYKRAKDNNYGIMDNDKIIDEYCKTMF